MADVRAVFLNTQRLITEHWPAAAVLLEPVLAAVRGEFTVGDLEQLCRDGRALAGIAFEGESPVLALVVEWRFYPRRTVLNVIALAGSDLDGVASTFWPTFTQWAQESGATAIEACVSPAMARLLQPLGFTHTYNVVRTPC